MFNEREQNVLTLQLSDTRK